MCRLLALLLLALAPIIGFAQGVGGGSVSGLTYITPITPGDCTKWQQVGVLADAGAACGSGSAGIGPGSVGQLCIFTSTTNCTGTPGTATNQLLYWNGTAWVPLTAPAADGDVLTRSSGALVWSQGTTYPDLPSDPSAIAATDLVAIYSQANTELATVTPPTLSLYVGTNSIATGTTLTPSCAYEWNYTTNTQAGGTLTVAAPSGTCAAGQRMIIDIKSTNVQTYSWNAAYCAGTTALPTGSSGSGKEDLIAFRYSPIKSCLLYVATATGF